VPDDQRLTVEELALYHRSSQGKLDMLLKPVVNMLDETHYVYACNEIRKLIIVMESGTAYNTKGTQLSYRLQAQSFLRGEYGQLNNLIKRFAPRNGAAAAQLQPDPTADHDRHVILSRASTLTRQERDVPVMLNMANMDPRFRTLFRLATPLLKPGEFIEVEPGDPVSTNLFTEQVRVDSNRVTHLLEMGHVRYHGRATLAGYRKGFVSEVWQFWAKVRCMRLVVFDFRSVDA
jgi:hypothetical protein